MCGKEVELINPGFHNTDAGPDFFNAKVKIGDVLWAGNIEVHTKSKEWFTHGHHKDKAYDNVILHVVHDYSGPIHSGKGFEIPTIEISATPHVLEHYETLKGEKQTIACHEHLPYLDDFFIHSFRDRLVTERLQRKTDDIINTLSLNGGDWEQVFLQTLFRAFGFSINADAFEQLSRTISHRIIAKHRSTPLQLEALLFGQAGFLSDDISDTYFILLKNEYAFLQAKYALKPLERHLWKFLRLRPSNFPTIRLAQLAHLLHRNDSLLRLVVDGDLDNITDMLQCTTSSYWQTHYQFGKLSNSRTKRLGDSGVRTILINAIAPVLFTYGRHIGNTEMRDKAMRILDTLPAEHNHIIDRWKLYGLKFNNAYDTQAHIQLFNEYCKHKKCLHCNIGHHFLSLHH